MQPEQADVFLNISTAQLRIFQLVASGYNVRQTAEIMHRTQPAISLTIRDMESKLGHLLFDRDNKMALTSFGQACLPVVAAFLRHHAKMNQKLRQLALGQAGFVAMGTTPLTSPWLAKAIALFRADSPGVNISLHSDNVKGLKDSLRNGDLDFCVCTHLKPNSEFSFQPIVRKQFGLICHKEHRLAGKPGLAWSEVCDVNLIDSALLKEELILESMGYCQTDRILAASLHIMHALLEENVGVTIMAEYAMMPDSKNLVFVPLHDPVLYSTLGILKLSDSAYSPTAQKFETIVKAQLAHSFGAG